MLQFQELCNTAEGADENRSGDSFSSSAVPELAISMERLLHWLAPVGASCVWTRSFGLWASGASGSVLWDAFWGGPNISAVLKIEWEVSSPYVFAVSLSVGIALLASVHTSFPSSTTDELVVRGRHERPTDLRPLAHGSYEEQSRFVLNSEEAEKYDYLYEERDKNDKSIAHKCEASYAISTSDGRILSYILLIGAVFLHALLRPFRDSSISHDLCDFVLVLSIPFLIHTTLEYKELIWWGKTLPNRLARPSTVSITNMWPPSTMHALRRVWSPIVASFLALIAFQHRYLIPLTISASYAIHGKLVQSTWVTSIFLLISSLLLLLLFWIYGKKKMSNGEYIFGNYHEDVFQVLLVSAILIGLCAFSLPWRMFPILFLAILSLSLFVSTRMVRFC